MSTIQADYESTPYPHYVHPLTDPARVAVLGRIFGMRPADPGAARVLEIGCGAGSNLLAMASRLPGSRFLGLDFAGTDIASARALAAEAGLDNVEFRQQDLLTWEPGGARFDYIIAWGVFSWVPDQMKDRLLALCRECLVPEGIACISYMTYPGCKQAESLRDLLLLRTAGLTGASEKISLAHQTLDFLDRAYASLPAEMAHAGFLRSEVRRIREKEGNFLLHDDLEEKRDPFYLLQFTNWAGRHGLRYLGDAEFHAMLLENLPLESARELAAMPLNQLETEQMIDYVVNRSFRATLLVGQATLDGALHAEALTDLCFQGRVQPDGPWNPGDAEAHFITPERKRVTLRSPPLVAFLSALAARPAAFTPHREILQAAQSAAGREFGAAEKSRLCRDLLTMYGRQQVEISARPFLPMAQRPARPCLTPLNMALARGRGIVATAFQESVRLNKSEQACCTLLDGTLGLEELVAATEWPGDRLERFLQGLHQAGCLAAPEV